MRAREKRFVDQQQRVRHEDAHGAVLPDRLCLSGSPSAQHPRRGRMTTRPRRSPGPVSRPDLPFRAGCRATPEVLMPALEETTVETPDMGIYGQTEVLTAGGIPTWDDPDIVTNDWRPFRLRQEASVTVRNFSTTTSPAKARVHCHTALFGIGARQATSGSRMAQATRLPPSRSSSSRSTSRSSR